MEEYKRIDIISSYPPNKGRLSEYAYALINALAEEGYRITVYSDVGNFNKEKIKVIKTWEPEDYISFIKLFHNVIRNRPRILIFNLAFAMFGKNRIINFIGFLNLFILNIIKKVMKFKTVLILHNIPDFLNLKLFLKETFFNKLGLRIAEIFAMTCDGVAVTMKMYKKHLEKKYKKRIFFLPHGTWNNANNDYELNNEKDAILFLGYISPSKKIESLAEIYSKIKRNNERIKLIIVASPHPNYPTQIVRLKIFKGMKDVELYEYLNEAEMPKIFNRAIAIVLPYETATGTSGVFHLASSFGVPAVATDLPEFREIEKEGGGIIICKDINEMVYNLEKLIKDQEYWKKLSERNKEYASSREWKRIAKELVKIIHSI